MKIQLKKISEEKYEITITDNVGNVVFNDQRYYNYMGEQMITSQGVLEDVGHLSTLFGEFTEIENDFEL